MMRRCFTEDTQGLQNSQTTRELAIENYREYLSDLSHIDGDNRDMTLMRENSVAKHLQHNRSELNKFFRNFSPTEQSQRMVYASAPA